MGRDLSRDAPRRRVVAHGQPGDPWATPMGIPDHIWLPSHHVDTVVLLLALESAIL